MPPSLTVILIALIGIVVLTAPLVAITAMSIRRDAHSPEPLREEG